MINLVGGTLIISAVTAIGYIFSMRLQIRFKSLEKFISALEFIKPDICIMDRRMEEVLKNADKRFGLGGMFLMTAENMREKGIKSAWEESVLRVSDSLCLNSDDIDIIKSLGERLGKTCAEDQGDNIDSVKLRLILNLNSAKEDYDKNGRVIRRCSVLTGALLVLMLI